MLKKTIAALLSMTLLLGCAACSATITTDFDPSTLTDQGSDDATPEKSSDTSAKSADVSQSG